MEKPNNIVLDASVVVKWFVDEEYTNKALKILDDYAKGTIMVCSVQLMPYEVINALRYDSAIGRGDLIQISQAISKFQIRLYPLINGLAESTINIALDSGTTIYDAAYLSLAIKIGARLYTADQKFINKLAGNEHLFHISNYETPTGS
ncbi:MAG: type II toxin-antitoxin system VapC family toxin [Candidatus Thermoplasmatota archaeon]|nr:type II toxin-antitoxin system VapC family toxin [Candidatus Thermoplasmatota archaeon]